MAKASLPILAVCCVVSLSCVRLFATPWTVACQAPLSLGILQARILEWIAMPSSRGSSQPRDRTQVSCIAGKFFIIWVTSKLLLNSHKMKSLKTQVGHSTPRWKLIGNTTQNFPWPFRPLGFGFPHPWSSAWPLIHSVPTTIASPPHSLWLKKVCSPLSHCICTFCLPCLESSSASKSHMAFLVILLQTFPYLEACQSPIKIDHYRVPQHIRHSPAHLSCFILSL